MEVAKVVMSEDLVSIQSLLISFLVVLVGTILQSVFKVSKYLFIFVVWICLNLIHTPQLVNISKNKNGYNSVHF